MNTSKTSTTSFENQVQILSDLAVASIGALDRFRDYEEGSSLGLNLAWAYKNGYFDITEKVVGSIQLSFLDLLSHCNLRDTGFSSLEEILEQGKVDKVYETIEDWVQAPD